MKLLCIIPIVFALYSDLYGQTISNIKNRLSPDSKSESVKKKDSLKGMKGFKQLTGKYTVVQVKDISREEGEQILRHMDSLIEEFLKIHEYPFGTQKCFITVYGLKKDFDRLAKLEHLENAGAFSYRKGINHYAVTYYSADLYSTLNHEALHLFIENIFKRDAPTWFNEGLACYYETCAFTGSGFQTNSINKERLGIAKSALHTKAWPTAKGLSQFSWKQFHGDNEKINYSVSWAIIYYLRNKDENAFKNFVNDLVLGKSFSTNIRTNYNMEPKELENDWVKYVERLR